MRDESTYKIISDQLGDGFKVVVCLEVAPENIEKANKLMS